MLRKAKRLPVIVMLALIAVFLGSLSGCGDSADPLGTGTIQFIDATGTIITTTAVVPNGTITLTAQVTNLRSEATSVPVIGEKVTFTLMTPNNGGSLTVVKDRTASDGRATALFTSGNSTYSDIVRATTGNGATATIHINKTGGTTDPRIETLTASTDTTPLVAGQSSVITAHIIDGNNSAVMGVLVKFSLPVNASGASFSGASADGNFYAYTDVGGNATAIYNSGSADGLNVLYDTVLAELQNGSSKAVSITRSAGTPLSIAVAASPSVVNAGQASVITATLTGDDNAGVLVSFSLPVNNSGGSLSAASAVTDGNGKAVVSYSAGANSPLLTVGDSVQASVGSISSAVAITRTGAAAPTPTTGLGVSLAAAPTSVAAGETSIVTATVTGDNVTGTVVAFSIPVNASGGGFIDTAGNVVPSISVRAGGTGVATAIYRAGSTATGTAVQDTLQATLSTGANAAAIITRTGTTAPTPTTYAIAIAASSSSVSAGQVSIVTATVTSTGTGAATPAAGVSVAFTLPVNSSGATLSSATAVTDSSGKAVVTYQPGTTNPTLTVQDTVQGAVGSVASAVAITRVGSATAGFSITISATPNPLLTNAAGGSSIVTANVKNNLGTVVTGVTVTFTSTAGNINIVPLGPVTVTTDGSGNATVVFTNTAGGGLTGTTAGVVTASITPVGAAPTYTASVVITNP